jgi:uncharacterized protein
VTGDDHARLGDDAEDWVTWIGNEAFMRLDDGAGGAPRHCAALVLDGASDTLSCSIYERRPQVCRDLARGEGACQGELAAKRERPITALRLLRRAT